MNVIIRVDASIEMGTGHLMRCLALAQAWQDARGESIFLMATTAPALEERLRSEKMEVVHLSVSLGSAEDAQETARLARQWDATWVVMDGYHFGAEYQQIIKEAGKRLLFVDDYGHAARYWADIVLNQNIYAHEGLYANREPYTQLLLGTRYALLRREFWQWRGWKREIPPVASKVLVTLGGADPDNVTLKVIQALQLVNAENMEVVVVVGASNPHYEQVQAAIQDSLFPIRLQSNVTNMPELMAWADVAVAAGGSTCWELAFMGLPSMVLILADNQRAIAEKLGKMALAVNLGRHRDVTPEKLAEAIGKLMVSAGTRSEMTGLCQRSVDGEGTARVAMHLEGKVLRLRPLRQDDCRLLWEWRNDPEVRAYSFYPDIIAWEKHLHWFRQKLHDPNCHIFIVIDRQDTPIGQVRFDTQDNEQAEISVSIERVKRSSGYGSLALGMAVDDLFCRTSIRAVHAFIKPHNQASIRAFEKVQFKLVGEETISGNLARHYIRIKGHPDTACG